MSLVVIYKKRTKYNKVLKIEKRSKFLDVGIDNFKTDIYPS